MKKYLFLVLLALGFIPSAKAQTKCEANISGFKFSKLYIMGNHHAGVLWAYKNLSAHSCFTPVTDITKADAILEVENPENDRYAATKASIAADIANSQPGEPGSGDGSVTCSSSGSSSSCVGSDGWALDTYCVGDSCTTTYGPEPNVVGPLLDLAALGMAKLNNKLAQASYMGDAKIYTLDHKLIWRSQDVKDHFPWMMNWQDKLHSGTLMPPCKEPGLGTSGKKAKDAKNSLRDWTEDNNCGITFDPIVSIDLKPQEKAAKEAAKQAKIDAKAAAKQAPLDEMQKNAEEAAAKQNEGKE